MLYGVMLTARAKERVYILIKLGEEMDTEDAMRGMNVRTFRIEEPMTGKDLFELDNGEYIYYINYYGHSKRIDRVHIRRHEIYEFNDDEDALLWFRLNY